MTEARNRFPFSIKEPEVYQADAYVRAGGEEERFFLARKGGEWRYDTYRSGKPEISYLKNEKVYVLDHTVKTWREQPKGPDPLMPTITGEGMPGLFEGRDHPKFEKVSTDGAVTKYRATSDETPGDIFIYFDTSLGMITREEFPGIDGSQPWVYELRNIKTEVDDGLFAIPAGYKKSADKK